MSEDLYKILGIPPDADEKEVRSAYRSLAKKYHPDKGKGSSGERFRAVQHAYDVLGDAHRRAAYDRDGHRNSELPNAPHEWSVFGNAPFSEHIDLRYLSRRPPTQRIEFIHPHGFRRAEADHWEDLIAFLFGDF